MFHELAIGGVYVPTLTLTFFIAVAIAWALGAMVARSNVYRLFWHPALMRICVFTCIFGALALGIYR